MPLSKIPMWQNSKMSDFQLHPIPCSRWCFGVTLTLLMRMLCVLKIIKNNLMSKLKSFEGLTFMIFDWNVQSCCMTIFLILRIINDGKGKHYPRESVNEWIRSWSSNICLFHALKNSDDTLSLTQNQKFTIILEKKKIKIQAHFQTCSRYFQKVSRYKYFLKKYLDIDTLSKSI